MVQGKCGWAVVHALLVARLVLPAAGESAWAEATLLDNLGTLHHDITSTSDASLWHRFRPWPFESQTF